MGEELKEYSLRIVPPSPVLEEVIHFKKEFRAVFGEQLFSKSKPHITIAAFQMDFEYQDILVRILFQLSRLSKFELEIEGFDIISKDSCTLYLKVSNSKGLKSVHRDFNILWIRDLHRKRSTLQWSNTPHMTISKAANEKMLHESLTYFQQIEYFRKFEVDRLTLVSKDKKTTWNWEYQIELSKKVH